MQSNHNRTSVCPYLCQNHVTLFAKIEYSPSARISYYIQLAHNHSHSYQYDITGQQSLQWNQYSGGKKLESFICTSEISCKGCMRYLLRSDGMYLFSDAAT